MADGLLNKVSAILLYTDIGPHGYGFDTGSPDFLKCIIQVLLVPGADNNTGSQTAEFHSQGETYSRRASGDYNNLIS
jgi:hypothetical protein